MQLHAARTFTAARSRAGTIWRGSGSYFRPDIRFDRTFSVRKKPLLFWVGVQNFLDRRNVTGVRWNQNTNRSENVRHEGLFPLIGIDWKF